MWKYNGHIISHTINYATLSPFDFNSDSSLHTLCFSPSDKTLNGCYLSSAQLLVSALSLTLATTKCHLLPKQKNLLLSCSAYFLLPKASTSILFKPYVYLHKVCVFQWVIFLLHPKEFYILQEVCLSLRKVFGSPKSQLEWLSFYV